MQKFKINVLFVILFSFFVNAQISKPNQTIIVDYDIVLNDTTDIESSQYAFRYQLNSNGIQSFQNLQSYIDTTLYDKDGFPHEFDSAPINKLNYFKDLSENKVIYGSAYNFRKSGKITDSLQFNFINGKATKTILGYECKQLIVSFRGRDYEVFYSTALSEYQDGPWKFANAPGLILAVKSFDNSVTMVANCIQYSQDIDIKSCPKSWDKRLALSYREFVEKRSSWRDNVKAKIRAEDPMSDISIPYRNFEIYHPYYVDNHR
ncbi:conserved hypothetical protein [Nonlabens ulvanivorans]|uniref:GLPGLI family protein n=1 Tax=Nonlabens ulvanivorans TaxID=906888 RepID=A0A081D7Z8_NONUL|nr:GLPGLI family protein [Nonlabens ulvanivorans]GAK75044.1 conserved hypothetical protein [Nonlabens ulvanivorans]GAK98920.1 conserved hypothetical protein [Nonlabens ulvanivorans]